MASEFEHPRDKPAVVLEATLIQNQHYEEESHSEWQLYSQLTKTQLRPSPDKREGAQQ
jgi:hypothetical protein